MTTKREDAESIIEDEEVIKGLDLKSQADDVLVIKSEEEPVVEKVEAPVENTRVSEPETPVVLASSTDPRGYKEIEPIAEPTPLEKSFATLKDRVAVLKSQGLTGEEALKQIQADYEEVANVIRAEFTPKPTPEQVANQNLEATLRSLLSEMLPQALAQSVAPIQAELSELRALSLVPKSVTPRKEEPAPQPRSLNPVLVQKAVDTINQKVSQFDLIAQRSVGLQ
jgi:hypothetical protein